jgi:hypothetical protein
LDSIARAVGNSFAEANALDEALDDVLAEIWG